jgi:hypothetical protein
MTTHRDLCHLRLAAQRIAGSGFATAPDAVRWMTAMQAQDFPGAVVSIALRTQSKGRADVVAAMDAGEIVRSWPMRGTLHFVPPEDLAWMSRLTAERLISGAATRRAQLGIDLPMIERARELAVAELSGGRRLSREALRSVWQQAGLLSVEQRGYHFIWHLAQSGTLCYGPTERGQQCLVLLDEWITKPRPLEHDEALGEWALRYFRSHGPATVKDFSWWTQLRAADVKLGMSVAKPQLERLVVDGVEYYLDPATSALVESRRGHARDVFLLPGFDEYLLGYQDRSAALAPEFAQRVVPGGNGMFSPTVVAGGEVVGTWKRAGTGAKRSLLATPFSAFTSPVQQALPRLYDRLPS